MYICSYLWKAEKKTGFRSCRFCIVIFWQSFNHHFYFMIYHAICFRGGFLRTAFGKSSVIRSSLYPFVTLFQFHALWETTAKGHAIKAAGWSDKVGNGVTAMGCAPVRRVGCSVGSRCSRRRSVRLTSSVARTRWPGPQVLSQIFCRNAWPSIATQESNRLLQLLCYLGLRTCQWCGRIWQTSSLIVLRA